MGRKGFSLPLVILLGIVLLSGVLILFLVKVKHLSQQENDSVPGRELSNTTINKSTVSPKLTPIAKIFKNGEFNTYKNEAYGIEFTYPSEWELEDHNAPTFFDAEKDYVAIQINISNRGSGLQPASECPATFAGVLIHMGNSRTLPTMTEDIDLMLTQGLGSRDIWGQIMESSFNNYKSLKVDQIKKFGCVNTTVNYIEQDDNYYAFVGVTVGDSATSTNKQHIYSIIKSIKISPPQY